jgi:hypothetical protein
MWKDLPDHDPEPNQSIKINKEAVAWAAGIYEGEGCIACYPKPVISNTSIVIQLSMIDRDILSRWGEIVGRGRLNGPYCRKEYKPIWTYSMSNYENVQYTIAIFWKWLGARRREQATTVLARYRKLRPEPTHRGTKTHCVHGHERSEANTFAYITRKGKVAKYCIPCNREDVRRYHNNVGTA